MPTVYQRTQDVLPNPLGYDTKDAEQIVQAFNQHLAMTYVLYFQVKKHHWLVRGPQWHDIHLLLDEVAEQLIDQADYFAERITYFGGIPISTMSALEQKSQIKPEGDGLMDLKEMLANDIIGTVHSLKLLRETHELTDKMSDFFDASQIEVYIGEREKFCHELHFYIYPVAEFSPKGDSVDLRRSKDAGAFDISEASKAEDGHKQRMKPAVA